MRAELELIFSQILDNYDINGLSVMLDELFHKYPEFIIVNDQKNKRFITFNKFNLERLFNVGAGFTESEDILPERFTTIPFTDGLSKDRTVNLELMLKDYYAVRKWDKQGIPKADKLKELGLSAH